MSLEKIISASHKEIAGSRTKNRLTVQISYAMQLIMDFYSTEFLVMMDYIEDVSIICNPTNPSEIHLYQVKTKSPDKQYSFTTIIKDKWYQELYNNAKKYQGFIRSAAVVCNTDVVHNNKNVFPNAKTRLDEKSIQKNIKKIQEAIAKDQKIKEEEVDLSKFYFIRSSLSTKGHKEEVEHEFEDFLLTKDPELQVATVKSIYNLLYDGLDEKFNNEIDENCTDLKEIFNQKGINSRDIKDVISCGLAIQIPTLDKLFSDFNITSVLERKKYAMQYRQIKMDMYSDMMVFVETKKIVLKLIEEVNQSGIDDMPEILLSVHEQVTKNNLISAVYAEEYYLKILIMILIYRYCYGGEIK
ncbi:dsDNA nuclease domain-containing protein [Dielma fastidiosa]|uniref:DUF4297 domain-containing protein n=1 Tax=Dielma fastidiosa TaxID=1034346 RepID=A0AB35US04_9FIRM|nr:dsDNA nuclease domain-containing protein [Dielma fastidiosa]MDY5167964.1 DUF4297 domain-containing protein [Dielma fastidiosa]